MKGQRGFTLIEVMVAAAILGMAEAALFGLFSKSLFNLKKVEDLRRYQLAGETIMNAALMLPKVSPDGKAAGRWEELNARWVLNVTPWLPSNLDGTPPEAVMKIDVQILWPGRSGERNIRLETIKPSLVAYSDYDFQHAIDTILSQ